MSKSQECTVDDGKCREHCYADARGGVMKQRETCPKCKHNCITGGPIEIDEGKVTQPVHCDHCGYCWVDVYRLVAREE